MEIKITWNELFDLMKNGKAELPIERIYKDGMVFEMRIFSNNSPTTRFSKAYQDYYLMVSKKGFFELMNKHETLIYTSIREDEIEGKIIVVDKIDEVGNV